MHLEVQTCNVASTYIVDALLRLLVYCKMYQSVFECWERCELCLMDNLTRVLRSNEIFSVAIYTVCINIHDVCRLRGCQFDSSMQPSYTHIYTDMYIYINCYRLSIYELPVKLNWSGMKLNAISHPKQYSSNCNGLCLKPIGGAAEFFMQFTHNPHQAWQIMLPTLLIDVRIPLAKITVLCILLS